MLKTYENKILLKYTECIKKLRYVYMEGYHIKK